MNLENYTRTKPEIGLCRQSKHTLVADRKPIIEISYEISQLIISQSKAILHRLQHYVNDDLKGIRKCDVGQFIDHKKESFADCPIIVHAPIAKDLAEQILEDLEG